MNSKIRLQTTLGDIDFSSDIYVTCKHETPEYIGEIDVKVTYDDIDEYFGIEIPPEIYKHLDIQDLLDDEGKYFTNYMFDRYEDQILEAFYEAYEQEKRF
jgi:hypothetical protein